MMSIWMALYGVMIFLIPHAREITLNPELVRFQTVDRKDVQSDQSSLAFLIDAAPKIRTPKEVFETALLQAEKGIQKPGFLLTGFISESILEPDNLRVRSVKLHGDKITIIVDLIRPVSNYAEPEEGVAYFIADLRPVRKNVKTVCFRIVNWNMELYEDIPGILEYMTEEDDSVKDFEIEVPSGRIEHVGSTK